MPILKLDISMSLDGFVAGPDRSLDEPLGRGGERLHDWVVRTAGWRGQHGREGGEEGLDSEIAAESTVGVGAYLMGRRMFSGGSGGWESDPNPNGWWGDTPPFGKPVFVLTHHLREPLALSGTTFNFVTNGIEAVLELAREAAGGEDVRIAGGADLAQQYLRAGLLDELQVHVAPILLGSGTRLFDGLEGAEIELEQTQAVASEHVTHVRYRVLNRARSETAS